MMHTQLQARSHRANDSCTLQRRHDHLSPHVDNVKAATNDFEGRHREILSDPSNLHIPRCPDAGRMIKGYTVMHNGLLMSSFGYYGQYSSSEWLIGLNVSQSAS